MKIQLILLILVACALQAGSIYAKPNPDTDRWSEKKANEWYAQYPWLVGCNYIPSSAINQLEMWQEETWDAARNDKELKLAADLGFNFIRVYLHDLAYRQDPEGFLKRMDEFLALTDKHGIKVMFVFFDDCWLDSPQPGKQPKPLPGVHNSGWLESPGLEQLAIYSKNKKVRKHLETYVKAVLNRFRNDPRVIIWDLYNEPGNNPHYREDMHGPGPYKRAKGQNPYQPLLRDVYIWAREMKLSQPVTSCVWSGNNGREAAEQWADVISFHNYSGPESLFGQITDLKKFKRPIICTEYMGRHIGSKFQTCLPVMQQQNVAAVNWGFVKGKTNTIYPWNSWNTPGKLPEPDLWFHDIFRQDGSPFDPEEIKAIKHCIQKSKQQSSYLLKPAYQKQTTWNLNL